VRASNATLRSEVSRHKADLEALKLKDPEFYKFLATTDSQLLAFQDSDEEGGGDDDEDEDDEAPAKGKNGAKKGAAPAAAGKKGAAAAEAEEGGEAGADDETLLTTARVDAWCAAAEAGDSLGSAARLLRGFRACAHYGDTLADEDERAAASAGPQLRVASSTAFNRLVLFVFSNMDGILRTLLTVGAAAPEKDGKRDGAGKRRKSELAASYAPEKLPRWHKVEPLARSYLGNALHLLTQLQDARMAAFVLRSLVRSAPFVVPFPRLAKKLLRATLTRFGDGAPRVRLAALLLLRSLALVLPAEGLDRCLRGAYRAFTAAAKFAGAAGNAEHVAFMSAAVVELYGLDPSVAYPLAYGAIRALAGALRNALTAASKDAYRAVYCWQAVHCMELWGRMLSQHGATPGAPLRPLVYPLSQVVAGAARLLPAARHAPLRIRLLALLQRLASSCDAFIPVAPQALELLAFPELSKPPLARAGAGAPRGDYSALLRVPKAELRAPAFQAYVVDSVLDIVADALAQWAYHPAFPELAHLPLRELRRFGQTTASPRFRRAAATLADAAARNADWVARARDGADFAPKDWAPKADVPAAVASFLATERAANGAPLAAVAAARRAAARQRAATARATDVRIGDVSDRKRRGDDDDDDGEDAAAADEDEGAAAAAKQRGVKRGRQAGAAGDEDELGAPGDDVVGELELSDDDGEPYGGARREEDIDDISSDGEEDEEGDDDDDEDDDAPGDEDEDEEDGGRAHKQPRTGKDGGGRSPGGRGGRGGGGRGRGGAGGGGRGFAGRGGSGRGGGGRGGGGRGGGGRGGGGRGGGGRGGGGRGGGGRGRGR
jgi:nucleolar complex protein 2